MSLENPFSKTNILPPERTSSKANEKLIASLLGTKAGEKYQAITAGALQTKTPEKPVFNLDTFDEQSFDAHELENRLALTKQYDTQRDTFQQIGLLEKKEGILGMEAVDGTFYPFPTLEEVHQRLREKQTLVEQKEKQGFKKLCIVPFGMSLQQLTETLKKTLLAHYHDMPDPSDPKKRIPDPTTTKLWSTNTDGTKEALKLDKDNPLYVLDQYQEKNISYFPAAYDQDEAKHGGQTKQALLKQNQAFHILLLENTPIPRQGNGATVGGRPQIEAGKTPREYLKLLQEDPLYQGEQGLTPEAWITQFLLTLHTKNEVIDDYLGNGSLNYNLAAYFQDSGVISYGCWNRGVAQARMYGYDARVRSTDDGARSAVMV
jgi:hypothetical protein